MQRMKTEDWTSPVSLEELKFVCYRMFPALPYSDGTCMWPLSWEPLRDLRSESVPAKAKSS